MHMVSLCCLLIFICNYLCSISYRVSLYFTQWIEYFVGEFMIAFLCMIIIVLACNSIQRSHNSNMFQLHYLHLYRL